LGSGNLLGVKEEIADLFFDCDLKFRLVLEADASGLVVFIEVNYF